MRSTGAPSGVARIIGLGGDWEIRQQVDGTVVTDLCGDGATTICTVTPLTEVGRWYHVAFTFDSSNDTYAIYVDGQLESVGNELGQYGSASGRGSLVRHAHRRHRILERRASRRSRLQPQVVPDRNSKICMASSVLEDGRNKRQHARPIRRAWAATAPSSAPRAGRPAKSATQFSSMARTTSKSAACWGRRKTSPLPPGAI